MLQSTKLNTHSVIVAQSSTGVVADITAGVQSAYQWGSTALIVGCACLMAAALIGWLVHR
jgi:hypothetical protein